MNRDEIRRVVEEEIRRAMESEPKEAPAPRRAARPAVARWLQDAADRTAPVAPQAASREPADPEAPTGARRATGISSPSDPEVLERLVQATPSRIAVGRAGTRYLTPVYIGMRADHAVAKDAVYSEAKDGFAQSLGCLEVRSRCKDRQEFLLYPGRGRRLDEASQALVEREGTRGADVQIIFGDGLSAWAAEASGPELLPALQRELGTAGFSLGRPLFVRFARVGVQDHIGVLLGAKATLICLGERPGLGTGDSLSIYLAYGPRLDQDNAEKNCISNVRPLGIRPPEAAREAAAILKRAFAAGHGGVAR